MERSIKDWGANIVALIAVVIANAMANGIPLGGQTTGEVSAKYPSLFTPAGYAFSIWGVIYLGLLAFVVYQALPAQRQNAKLAKIGKAWIASCVFNVIWIFLWHYDFLVLSLLAMAGILLSLVSIYRELGIAISPASTGRKWFVHLPFSLYTGWISVAIIANISAVQIGTGWDDLFFSPTTWTILKLAVAGAVGATLICRRRDIPATLVVAWAAWAISVKQIAEPAIAGAAQALTIVAILLVIFELARLATSKS